MQLSTVSGAITRTAASVTVNTLTADRYADAMFAWTNLPLSNGQNSLRPWPRIAMGGRGERGPKRPEKYFEEA